MAQAELMIMRFARWFLLALLMAGLTACKVELHTGLSEDESNEMVALLLSRNIDASKTAADKEGVSLMVDSADLASAIEILQEHGHPRDQFSDLGTVFAQQGLISSPLEERARFIYAISQSISETLSQIDGVVRARVHVNMPEQDPLAKNPINSSASVFLKTRTGVNLEHKIPQIKMIVQNSVAALSYDDVVVVLFEAEPPPASIDIDGPALSEVLGMRFTQDSDDTIITIAAGFCLLLLAAIGGNAYFFLRLRKLER